MVPICNNGTIKHFLPKSTDTLPKKKQNKKTLPEDQKRKFGNLKKMNYLIKIALYLLLFTKGFNLHYVI